MFGFFFFLCVVFVICLLVGMINPGLVIRWGNNRTRRHVSLVYSSLFLLSFGLMTYSGISSPSSNETHRPTAQTEKRMQEINNILEKLDVTVKIDNATMDSKDRTKVGVFIKNNSDYRITKGYITVRLKDAAKVTIDSDSLDFVKPIDSHRGSAGALWLNAKRAIGYEYNITIKEYQYVGAAENN